MIYIACPYCGSECYSMDGLLSHIHNKHEEIRITDVDHLARRMEAIGYDMKEFLRKGVDNIS